MSIKLYDENSFLTEFKANVISCEKCDKGYKVVLDQTAFFPESGGQCSDTGTIAGTEVFYVLERENEIIHFTKEPVYLGEANCKIDWDKRFRNMQHHSGEHIVSGLMHKIYGADNVGFHLGETEVTMDFNVLLTREDLIKIEKSANVAIIKNVPFTCWYPTAEELKSIDYRSKLDLTENVRLVKIEGYDICACCAPHVNSAAQIGVIKLLDFCKLRGGTRVWLKCGFDALEDYNRNYLSVQKISALTSSRPEEVDSAVEGLNARLSELSHEISMLKSRLILELAKNEKFEANVTASFADNLDNKELQLFADSLLKQSGGIRGAFSGSANGFNFAICGEEEMLNVFFKKLKEMLSINGGGRGGIVQGKTTSKKSEILRAFAFLSEEL